jgi:hypothetical protein
VSIKSKFIFTEARRIFVISCNTMLSSLQHDSWQITTTYSVAIQLLQETDMKEINIVVSDFKKSVPISPLIWVNDL